MRPFNTFLTLTLFLAACSGAPTPTNTPSDTATQPAPSPTAAAATDLPATVTPPTTEPTAEAQPTETTAAVQPGTQPDPACCTLTEALNGFNRPLYLTHAGDDRLFVVEQDGLIRIADASGQILPTPFLDLTGAVATDGNEQGLLGLAFHPNYVDNGYFYVNYTAVGDGRTVVARYSVSVDPNVADAASATELFTVDQPAENHNGGSLVFGPDDGLLYIGMGDGGGAGDPSGNGQNPDALLGKMLRLDVDIEGAQPQIWAMGLRNPWRFSFDRATGDMFIGDVGQGAWEEIDYVPAPLQDPGPNFGWNILEGTHRYSSVGDPAGLLGPVAEYSHDEGGCSVTGGYVYRGASLPALAGVYFFADFCSGTIWSLVPDGSGAFNRAVFLETGTTITSFGEDLNGELYIIARGGVIFKLTGN
jgi:glucose/arabinose dehydrogenase